MTQEIFLDPLSGIQKIFFVVCYLLQSSSKEERVLAYRTLECFPRKEFLESELALLLGETLLRDSMDQDILIAALGIKGILIYSINIEYAAPYLKNWLTHPSYIIRESCLVGLLDFLTRYHYGWDTEYQKCLPPCYPLWSFFDEILPLIEMLSFDVNEPTRENEILREKSIQILEMFPLLPPSTEESISCA